MIVNRFSDVFAHDNNSSVQDFLSHDIVGRYNLIWAQNGCKFFLGCC